MKSLNFLNRCTQIFLRLTMLLTQIFGVTIFIYDKNQHMFRRSSMLRIYGFIILTIMLMHMFHASYFVLPEHSIGSSAVYLGCNVMVLVVRLHVLINSGKCTRLLNKMQEMLTSLQQMSKHPNIFRLSHLLLLMLTLQSLLRSLSSLYNLEPEMKFNLVYIYVIWLRSTALLTFVLQITINICLFIVLIACYDELRQNTKKISKAVHTLRQAQVLEGGQLLVLVEQLRCLTEDLIVLRFRIYRLNMKLIRLFRFHWLCTFIYWLLHIVVIPGINRMVIYKHAVALMNMAFYCTIFEIFIWKSKISKSFWHFHLINYHAEFDRTIETLFHQEIIQRIKVSVYGINLDMKFLFKLLSICVFYIFVHTQNYLQIKLRQEKM